MSESLTLEERRTRVAKLFDKGENAIPMPHNGNGKHPAASTNGEGDNLINALASALQGKLTPTTPSLDVDAINELIGKAIAEATLPRPLAITINGQSTATIDGAHCQLPELLKLLERGRNNLLIVGPAGSGKTTIAAHLAKAMNRPFAYVPMNEQITCSQLFGGIRPNESGDGWAYQPTELIEAYQKESVILLDEFDAPTGDVGIALNAMLANGHFANPCNHGRIINRGGAIIVASMNTWGNGADQQYIRNRQDSATMDRFVLAKLFIDYDADLEKRIAGAHADTLIPWIADLRETAKRHKLRRIVSTRLVEASAAALQSGMSLESIKAEFFVDWSTDEKAKVGYRNA